MPIVIHQIIRANPLARLRITNRINVYIHRTEHFPSTVNGFEESRYLRVVSLDLGKEIRSSYVCVRDNPNSRVIKEWNPGVL
jgi:hypothetical protein